MTKPARSLRLVLLGLLLIAVIVQMSWRGPRVDFVRALADTSAADCTASAPTVARIMSLAGVEAVEVSVLHTATSRYEEVSQGLEWQAQKHAWLLLVLPTIRDDYGVVFCATARPVGFPAAASTLFDSELDELSTVQLNEIVRQAWSGGDALR